MSTTSVSSKGEYPVRSSARESAPSEDDCTTNKLLQCAQEGWEEEEEEWEELTETDWAVREFREKEVPFLIPSLQQAD